MADSIGWRIWLGDMPLGAVHLLACDPPLVAVWGSPREAYFFGAYDADYLGKLTVPAPPADAPHTANWRDFLDGLRAPDGTWLPVVKAGAWQIHTSYDGRFRVLHTDRDLLVEIDGDITPLERESDEPLAAVALDRELGTVAALDGHSRLQFFQQALAMGTYTLDGADAASGCLLTLPDAPDAALVVAGVQALLIDTAGQIRQQTRARSPLTAVDIAPDASLVATAESASLRILDGRLVPLWQAAVPDLLDALDPLDDDTAAISTNPAVPVRSVAILAEGTIGFVAGGMLGIPIAGAFEPLPQPRPLL